MSIPLLFREYVKRIPDATRSWAVAVFYAVVYTSALMLWVACLPFAAVVIPIRRMVRGKRLARRWKAKHGCTCPEMWRWWLRYM
jgi:hypothetical protein